MYDPGMEVEDLFLGLRQRGVPLSKLPTDFASVAAFVSYCGALEGDGHTNLLEEDDLYQFLAFAQAGAARFGLKDIVQIISEVTDALREDPNPDLSELETRFYNFKLTDQDGALLMKQLAGVPLEKFRVLWNSEQYGARSPHWAHSFVWLANNTGLLRQIPQRERRSFLDETAQRLNRGGSPD